MAALVASLRLAAFFSSFVCAVSVVIEETSVFSPQAVMAMAVSRIAACFNMFIPQI